MMLRAAVSAAVVQRAVVALEIGSLGFATAVTAYMVGVEELPILIGLYFATVAVASALARWLEWPPAPQAGHD